MRGELDYLMRNPVTRRKFLQAMMVAGGGGVLAACRKAVEPGGSTSSSTSGARPAIADEPGVLHVHEWAGYDAKWIWKEYADKGYPDPKFSFLVNTEGALAKTAAGFEWDTTHPEVGYVQDYITLGAIQPWDTSLIPNFSQLNPALEKTGVIDDKQYEIVLDWGYSGVAIRTDHVDPELNSYQYLFDDAYQGHIAWFDTPWILQMAAVTLGIPGNETFDMSSDQMDAAKAKCIEAGKNVYNIWADPTTMQDDIRQDNVWAAYAWQDTYMLLKDEVPVQYVKPKEGVFSWAEGLILRSDTDNYYHAHEFADAWASEPTGFRLITSWGYGHANTTIDLDKVDPDVVKVFGLDDVETALSEPNSWIDRYQAHRNDYNRAWEEVKASL